MPTRPEDPLSWCTVMPGGVDIVGLGSERTSAKWKRRVDSAALRLLAGKSSGSGGRGDVRALHWLVVHERNERARGPLAGAIGGHTRRTARVEPLALADVVNVAGLQRPRTLLLRYDAKASMLTNSNAPPFRVGPLRIRENHEQSRFFAGRRPSGSARKGDAVLLYNASRVLPKREDVARPTRGSRASSRPRRTLWCRRSRAVAVGIVGLAGEREEGGRGARARRRRPPRGRRVRPLRSGTGQGETPRSSPCGPTPRERAERVCFVNTARAATFLLEASRGIIPASCRAPWSFTGENRGVENGTASAVVGGRRAAALPQRDSPLVIYFLRQYQLELIDAIDGEGVDPTPPAKDDGCISCCVTQ